MTNKINFDEFKTETIDGFPFELVAVVEWSTATVFIPGMIKARLCATMPKDKAFALYHNVSIMTWKEVRTVIEAYLNN